tara:strand:- start:20 stop:568 length:549 start_codon:yes stop_codon:yes gene_type:complete
MNNTFKALFLDKFSCHLKHTFNEGRINSIIDEFESLYSNEIEEHIDRWSYPESKGSWENEVENLRVFAKERPYYITENIKSFFELPDFGFECILAPLTKNLIVIPNPNKGDFFLLNSSDIDIINATITITNINGQEVYKEDNIDLVKRERKYFHLSNFSYNMYVLQIVSTNYSEQMKIVISN